MIKTLEKQPVDGAVILLSFTDGAGRKHEAKIASLGAALRTYSVDGNDVIVEFRNDGFTNAYCGMILLPFPNRLDRGTYKWPKNDDGTEFSAPINEPTKNNNLHSSSQYFYFDVLTKSDSSVTLGLRLPSTKWYPFDIYTEVTYTLNEKGVEISTESVNLGDKSAPWALGFHPWFATRNKRSESKLLVGAKKFVDVNERSLPISDDKSVAEKSVQGTKFDLLQETQIGENSYDHAWTDVVLSNEVVPEFGTQASIVALTGADGHKTTILADANFTSWQICTRDDTDGVNTYETVAIEPMTAYANAFKTGDYLIELQPDQPFKSQWRIEFE
jgi:aldose 1-epimerase